MSRKLKKLIYFGCPICLGNLDYCTDLVHSKKECIKSKKLGFFKKDPNSTLALETMVNTLINNTKDDSTG